MKTKVLFIFIASLGLLLASCGVHNSAQSGSKQVVAEEINALVNNFDFMFEASYAHPTGYRSIYLSPYYSVKLSPDTVNAYLPYYGRAYTAPMNRDEAGIKFTSTDFEYRVNPGRRKGNWQIDIRTKDTGREILLHFDIWENGTARLNVIDQNRQPISFQGNIVSK